MGCADGPLRAALSLRGHCLDARASPFDSWSRRDHFQAVLKAIHATNYDGWITVELYPYIDQPDEAALEAFTYMAGTISEAGIELKNADR